MYTEKDGREGWLLSAGHISVLRWAPPWLATALAMGQICWKPARPRRLPILQPGLESEPILVSHRTGMTEQLSCTRPPQLSSEKRLTKGFANCKAPFKHKGGRWRGHQLPNEKDLSALPSSRPRIVWTRSRHLCEPPPPHRCGEDKTTHCMRVFCEK